MVSSQMDEPPGTRLRGRTCPRLTMEEQIRDVQQQDVLPFIDNIFRLQPGPAPRESRRLGPEPPRWIPDDAGPTRWACPLQERIT